MRTRGLATKAAVTAAALVGTTIVLGPATAGADETTDMSRAAEYFVLLAEGADHGEAMAAIERAGGTVVRQNTEISSVLVRAGQARFVPAVAQSDAIAGVARNSIVGHIPENAKPSRDLVERLSVAERQAAAKNAATRAAPTARGTAKSRPGAPDPEPLAYLQWGMDMIGATATGSYARERGDDRVLVGILDTGVDGSHPDIAANFNRELSRNFTTDIPEVTDPNDPDNTIEIDGECEYADCVDPVDVDHNGHGTHVASIVGSPINGLGVAGVAPEVTLVNIRAGQDSGYFFLQPTVDALTYAGRIGVDVVNMSYYVDPWLYNCTDNPADSPEAQLEQRTIREAVQRAADYASRRGVTLVAASGNGGTDLANPTFDDSSPDFPPGINYPREVDNSCIDVPTESEGVLSINALGPSKRKSYFSNYGTEQSEVAAPGGDAFDSPNNQVRIESLILAAYPEAIARARGEVDENGEPTTPFVVRDCDGDTCAYYQYLQGTSMASPHATGVASLVVSRFGHRDRWHRGGLTLNPRATRAILRATATDTACPTPRDFEYVLERSSGTVTFTHRCEGGENFNGFYGDGIISAATVAGRR